MIIRFDSDTTVAGYDPDRYLAQYNAAGGDINAMRRAQYTRNKDKINAQKRAAYAAKQLREVSDGGIVNYNKAVFAGKRDITWPLEKHRADFDGWTEEEYWQRARELLSHNPADACKRPRPQKPEIRPLDEQEMAAFLEAIRGDPFEAIYLVDLYTGLRRGEILGLCWDCVNFDAGTIHVQRQLQKARKGGWHYFSAPKNGKGRVVAMPETVRRALKQIQQAQRLLRLRAGGAWIASGGVWADSERKDAYGRYIADQTVYHHFKKLAASIGRPDARFHDLRHSYAVAAIRSGDDIKTV